MNKQSVLIIGSGVIGGSLARKLAENENYHVSVWSNSSDDLSYLKNRQTRDRRIESLGIADDLDSGLKAIAGKEDAIVVLATPPSFFPELIRTIHRHAPRAIITDTASVKQPVVKMVETLKAEEELSLHFVPAHPIAGNAGSGARHSDPTLFTGKQNMIVKPKSWDSDQWQREARLVEKMWMDAGCATSCTISPDIHDRIYAAVSHAPQLTAFGLGDMDKATFDPHSQEREAFYQFVRLTESPRTSFWKDVFQENGDIIREVIGHYRSELTHVKTLVSEKKWDELGNYIKQAQKPLIEHSWRVGQPITIPEDAATRQTMFPVIAGAAFSKALCKAQQNISSGGETHDLFKFANSGLKSILAPLAIYLAPSKRNFEEHEFRLNVLLNKFDKQLVVTSDAMLGTKRAEATVAAR